MKNMILSVLVLGLWGCSENVRYYTNPLEPEIADPAVLKDGDVYYIYGTTAHEKGYETWKSADLVNWEYCGFVFEENETTWGQMEFWAPEVIKKDGEYYLFYSARNQYTNKRICVAKSNRPVGPFKDVAAPLFESYKAVIDAHPFIDDDGQAYLYYVLDMSDNKISEIYVVRLSDDMVSVVGERVHCIKPSQKWEGTVWNEAPYVIKNKGKYYLFYSANCFLDKHYQVGYAVADNPMGPWEKYEDNPILRASDDVSGSGHNSVVSSPDGSELFIVYHTHWKIDNSFRRGVSIDRMRFVEQNDETVIKIDGPSTGEVLYPSNRRK